jgi:hypothetical protein
MDEKAVKPLTDEEFNAMFPDFDDVVEAVLSAKQLMDSGKTLEEAVDIVRKGGNIEDPKALGWAHFTGEYFEIQSLDVSDRFKNVKYRDDAAIEAHRKECGCPWPECDYQARFCSQLWDSGCSHDGPANPHWPEFSGDARLKRKFQTLYGLAEEREKWEDKAHREVIVARTTELLAVLSIKMIDASWQAQRDKLRNIIDGCMSILTTLAKDLEAGRARWDVVFTHGDDWEECEKCGRGVHVPDGRPGLPHLCTGVPVRRLD